METKTALFVGASGLVGGHCLQFLLEEPSYTRVVVLVRRPLAITHDKLVQHVVDFSELETLSEHLTADDVYCCLGTTIKNAGTQDAFRKVDFDHPVKIGALTQHCGAAQFLLVSSLDADPHSRIFYNRVKGEVEEAIRKISFITINIFRPSLLLGKRTEVQNRRKSRCIYYVRTEICISWNVKKIPRYPSTRRCQSNGTHSTDESFGCECF